MQAGLLNRIIEIYKPETITNSVGATTVNWNFVRQTRAKVRNLSMNRSQEINEIFYPTTREFIVRSYVEIDDFYRIKYDGKFYKIMSIDRRRESNDIVVLCDLINE